MRLVSGATARCNIANLYNELKWQSIKQRRDCVMATMLFKIKNGLAPSYLYDLLPRENREYVQYNLRGNRNLSIPFTRLESYRRSLFPFSIRLWNFLSVEIRSLPGVQDLKNALISELEESNVFVLLWRKMGISLSCKNANWM